MVEELLVARKAAATVERMVGSEKEKYTGLQKKLEDIKRKDGVEEMKLEVSKDQQGEAKLAAENAKLMKKLDDVKKQSAALTGEKAKLDEEDKASSTKLHELVDKMQSALSVAKEGEDATQGPGWRRSGAGFRRHGSRTQGRRDADRRLGQGVRAQEEAGALQRFRAGRVLGPLRPFLMRFGRPFRRLRGVPRGAALGRRCARCAWLAGRLQEIRSSAW